MNSEIWRTFSWHCPNCGEISTGFQNDQGVVRVECRRCHVVSVLRPKGRRHGKLDVYAPDDEEFRVETAMFGGI